MPLSHESGDGLVCPNRCPGGYPVGAIDGPWTLCSVCEARRITTAQEVYENLPPEAVKAAANFIRGLLFNLGDGPLDEANAAKNCASHILHAAGWRP